MTLPNAERAIVDIRKLRDYCLNPLHDEGQHKARLFATTLGMTADDAESLRDLLLKAVTTHEAHLGRRRRNPDEVIEPNATRWIVRWYGKASEP